MSAPVILNRCSLGASDFTQGEQEGPCRRGRASRKLDLRCVGRSTDSGTHFLRSCAPWCSVPQFPYP